MTVGARCSASLCKSKKFVQHLAVAAKDVSPGNPWRSSAIGSNGLVHAGSPSLSQYPIRGTSLSSTSLPRADQGNISAWEHRLLSVESLGGKSMEFHAPNRHPALNVWASYYAKEASYSPEELVPLSDHAASQVAPTIHFMGGRGRDEARDYTQSISGMRSNVYHLMQKLKYDVHFPGSRLPPMRRDSEVRGFVSHVKLQRYRGGRSPTHGAWSDMPCGAPPSLFPLKHVLIVTDAALAGASKIRKCAQQFRTQCLPSISLLSRRHRSEQLLTVPRARQQQTFDICIYFSALLRGCLAGFRRRTPQRAKRAVGFGDYQKAPPLAGGVCQGDGARPPRPHVRGGLAKVESSGALPAPRAANSRDAAGGAPCLLVARHAPGAPPVCAARRIPGTPRAQHMHTYVDTAARRAPLSAVTKTWDSVLRTLPQSRPADPTAPLRRDPEVQRRSFRSSDARRAPPLAIAPIRKSSANPRTQLVTQVQGGSDNPPEKIAADGRCYTAASGPQPAPGTAGIQQGASPKRGQYELGGGVACAKAEGALFVKPDESGTTQKVYCWTGRHCEVTFYAERERASGKEELARHSNTVEARSGRPPKDAGAVEREPPAATLRATCGSRRRSQKVASIAAPRSTYGESAAAVLGGAAGGR
ncbi:hypothetical protein CERSUDRAFT_77543 [Gelatoporia subvermispora B]|uniref:Uncharacterized protein n=1 Tax=Ceriporiopsis subvermispora (strain B) TaxID=914234 RepID=M2R043_CERS8|nr:hypothetical protein CERSUDRAFT_77543 [Gelatoporia subvermispora B]